MIARSVQVEVLAWTAISIVAWAISAHFGVANTLSDFTWAHEEWQLDEFFALITILSISAFVASMLQARRNLTRRRAAERHAYEAARVDVLTNLPNRRMFVELAGSALGEAWKSGSQCSVLFLDLDGFKPVNDTFGHTVGDKLLIAVGARLQASVSTTDVVARMGGDEFAIMLLDAGRHEAMRVAQGILSALQRPFEISGRQLLISVSIGIGIGPDSGRRAEDLTDAADRAMYMSKRAGRGTIRILESDSYEGESPLPGIAAPSISPV